MALDKEKEKLFRIVRRKLGSDVRKVELTDDMLCDLVIMHKLYRTLLLKVTGPHFLVKKLVCKCQIKNWRLPFQ